MDERGDANLRILGEQSCVAIGVFAVVKTLEIRGRNENMKLATHKLAVKQSQEKTTEIYSGKMGEVTKKSGE
jgi:hypothetical protein